MVLLFLLELRDPENARLMYTSGFYVWNTPAMQTDSSADNYTPHSSNVSHTSHIRGDKIEIENIFKAHDDYLDKSLHVKKVLGISSNSRGRKRKDI